MPAEQQTKPTAPARDRVFVESVARAFRVLEAFAERPEPQTLSQLANAAGIDKSAAQRLSHTLVQLGYLDQVSGGLVPGRKVLDRTLDYLRSEPLVRRAIPILAELRREARERVDLSLFEDLTLLYVVRLQSKRDSLYGHLIGRRVPTFCTAGGRAVLARLPRSEAIDIIERSARRKHTPRTRTEVDEVLACVDQARDAGFALIMEELHIGEVAVAAPVMDKNERPVGAVHVGGSLGEWEPAEFARRFGPLTVAAATAITRD